MIETVQIKRKTEKQANTKYGPKTTYSMLCSTSQGDIWISLWSDAQTSMWAEGQTVEMDITQNGKYWNGKPVPQAPSQNSTNTFPQGTKPVLTLPLEKKIDELIENTRMILDLLNNAEPGSTG